jgi:hypothetical protein
VVATSARIGLITQEFRTVVSSDSAVKTKYGELARDTADRGGEAVETFFDSTADAQVMANARLALVKPDRRRFRIETRGVQTFTGTLDFTQTTPAATVIDDERGANLAAAIVEIAVDLGGEKTILTTWGT